MAPNFEVRIATAWDAEQLAATMRAEDVAEVAAAAGFTPLEALLCSMRVSEVSFTLEIAGTVAAMFGVAVGGGTLITGPSFAAPWALTGRAVERHPVLFASLSFFVVEEWRKQYPLLLQMIDARYTKALRWAEWLGFRIHAPEPFGTAGLPFHPVSLRSAHV